MSELHGNVRDFADVERTLADIASRKVPHLTIASRIPVLTDDIAKGHDRLSHWLYVDPLSATRRTYVCMDSTQNAAVWSLYADTASPAFGATIDAVQIPLAASLTEVNVL